jgi:hypothetical protein
LLLAVPAGCVGAAFPFDPPGPAGPPSPEPPQASEKKRAEIIALATCGTRRA